METKGPYAPGGERSPNVRASSRAARPAAPIAPPAKPPDTSPDMTMSEIAQAWIGVWAVLTLVLKLVGWFAGFDVEVEEMTTAEANADAPTFVPIVKLTPKLARVARFAGAPVVLMRRVKDKIKIKRKGDKPPEAIKPAVPPVPPEVIKEYQAKAI